jgi:hypothetical protein
MKPFVSLLTRLLTHKVRTPSTLACQFRGFIQRRMSQRAGVPPMMVRSVVRAALCRRPPRGRFFREAHHSETTGPLQGTRTTGQKCRCCSVRVHCSGALVVIRACNRVQTSIHTPATCLVRATGTSLDQRIISLTHWLVPAPVDFIILASSCLCSFHKYACVINAWGTRYSYVSVTLKVT